MENKKLDFDEVVARSLKIRELYQQLELEYHGSKWSVEEDALAFLTDAGLVGRLTMAQQGRWPKGEKPEAELSQKLGESIWWLIVLSNRMNIDIKTALDGFLSTTENLLKK
jgi:hypothetical protein